MIKIDKGVPVPGRRPHLNTKYPWHDMKPGDSFFVPGMGVVSKSGQKQMSADGGRNAHPGSKWLLRPATEKGVAGVRVWRLS